MQKKLLKTTLFGFSKTEVCEYIARTNSEYNDRIEALIAEHTKEKKNLLEEIAELKTEIDKYNKLNADIAEALTEAKKYSEELKKKADEEYQSATKELNELKRVETDRLNNYRKEIKTIKNEIVTILSNVEGKLSEKNLQSDELIKKYRSEEGIII
ncbi:MAG: hypothetical protein IJD37_04105 [Clostridia bacterium]|nr:hypothetical protein [Clostridia bacterium]